MTYLGDALSEAIKAAAAWAAPAVLTGLLAWWAIKRKSLAAARAQRRAQRAAMAALPTQLEKLATAVCGIEKQVRPNGGGSLMDAVTRIEARGQEHGTAIEEIRSSITSIDAIVRAQSDLAVDGSFECDPTGANTWVNITYARMLGVGRIDLLGNAWKNYVSPEDQSVFLTANAAALAEHRSFNGRCRMVRSDGDVIEVDVTIIPFPERPPAKRWFGKVRLVA